MLSSTEITAKQTSEQTQDSAVTAGQQAVVIDLAAQQNDLNGLIAQLTIERAQNISSDRYRATTSIILASVGSLLEVVLALEVNDASTKLGVKEFCAVMMLFCGVLSLAGFVNAFKLFIREPLLNDCAAYDQNHVRRIFPEIQDKATLQFVIEQLKRRQAQSRVSRNTSTLLHHPAQETSTRTPVAHLANSDGYGRQVDERSPLGPK